MFYTQESFATFAMLMANVIFFTAMLPQLLLNYKLKSTHGLSDLFILASFNGQLAYLGYAFSANLPLVYKVMNTLYAMTIIILVFQRFYYRNYEGGRKILWAYMINLLIMFMLIFMALNSSVWAISFLGWLPVLIGSLKKYPQVVKIYKSKSIEGFSILFVLITLFAYSFELLAAIVLKLPAPVLFNDLRGIVAYSVFLFQFGLYKNSSQKKVRVYARS